MDVSFTKNMSKNIGQNITKNLARTFLIILKKLQRMHLKLVQREQFKKEQKQQVIWLVNKITKVSKNPQQSNSEKKTRYLDYIINLTSEAVNRLFVLSFENNTGQASYTRYYLPRLDIKDYNVTIDGSMEWLHDWLFTRLSLFQKLL